MIDDFFQQKPADSDGSKFGWIFLFRCLFYTSIVGFVSGSAFGYLHMRGWVPNADDGLLLYSITFAIGAILSTCFVFYQVRQNRLKAKKIKVRSKDQ
jgi:hypothetical protein